MLKAVSVSYINKRLITILMFETPELQVDADRARVQLQQATLFFSFRINNKNNNRPFSPLF
jgi:hypothetical protein